MSTFKLTYLDEILEEDDRSESGSELEMTPLSIVPMPNTIEPKTKVAWSLQFHRQNMTEFVSMTNGLDPAMQLGYPIRISLPQRPRSRTLFDLFKSHASYDHYDPHDKVTIDIELPTDHETVYNAKADEPLCSNAVGTTLFDLCIGRLRDIYVRTSLETLVQDYYFRPTLLSAMQRRESRMERLILCTINYIPLLDIQYKLDFLARHSGVWIKVGKWCKPELSGFEGVRPWLVVAVVSASLYRTLRKDPQVKRIYKEPSYLESKRDDARLFYGSVFSGISQV